VTSGEWASGKKWADDAPREVVDADSVSLINIGGCGAFVHGLEDEFMGKLKSFIWAILPDLELHFFVLPSRLLKLIFSLLNWIY
jgi:hypothetical protein